jgi:hypothetical protein
MIAAEKTYPPEMATTREECVALIRDAQCAKRDIARVYADPAVTLRGARDYARDRVLSCEIEIADLLRLLASLEPFATIPMRVPLGWRRRRAFRVTR